MSLGGDSGVSFSFWTLIFNLIQKITNEKTARIGERIVSLGGDSGAVFSFLNCDFVLYHSLYQGAQT